MGLGITPQRGRTPYGGCFAVIRDRERRRGFSPNARRSRIAWPIASAAATPSVTKSASSRADGNRKQGIAIELRVGRGDRAHQTVMGKLRNFRCLDFR